MCKLNVHKKLQLAKTISMDSVKMPCIAELKLDGVRGYIQNNKVYTRAGNRIHLPKIEAILDKNLELIGYINDLEITLHSGKMADRPIVSGMVNSAIHGKTIDEDLLYFNIFDVIPKSDFIKMDCPYHNKARQHMIESVVKLINQPQFRRVKRTTIYSVAELKKLYNDYIAEGYEGVVTKHDNDLYQFKRSAQWGRFKAIKTADLKCIGINAGKGKHQGRIGSLTLEGFVDGKHVIVKVSGMSDALRCEPDEYYLNKIIEVKYNSITRSKETKQHSLFLPRFLMVRMDK